MDGIQYRFDLYYSGSKVAELTDIDNISFGYKRNDFVPCSFTYNAKDIDQELLANLVIGAELRIFRKKHYGNDLKLIYAGEIQTVDKSVDQEDNKLITCEVIPWGSIFFTTRFITKTYLNQAEEDIAWDIIDTIQTDTLGGALDINQVNWGIIRDTEESSGNVRERNYEDGEPLTLFQQLADVNDIEPNPQRIRGFRLSPDLTDNRFNYWQWQANYGTSRNVTYISESIESIHEISSIKNLANKIVANGKDALQEDAITEDQSNLSFYRLRQAYISKTNISTSDELEESAVNELAVRQSPPAIYSIELSKNDYLTGEYRVGDYIQIKYDDGFISVDDTFQVYSINISYDGNGIETTKLVISQAKPVSTATSIGEKLVENISATNSRLTNLEK